MASSPKPSTAEANYLEQWISAGFDAETILLAYSRTTVQTGSLKWSYMDKILKAWEAKGLFTTEQILAGDGKPDTRKRDRNGDFQQQGQPLSPAMQRAVDRLLNKKEN